MVFGLQEITIEIMTDIQIRIITRITTVGITIEKVNMVSV